MTILFIWLSTADTFSDEGLATHWRSNCTELLDECLSKYGAPEIINTDQGSRYTSPVWIDAVKRHEIQVSMGWQGQIQIQYLERIILEVWKA